MDGVNFDMMNRDIRGAIALNKVYGLKWEEVSFTEKLTNPASGRANVFFTSANEALKVANFLNECEVSKCADISRQYSVVQTRYDELRSGKDMLNGKPIDFKIFSLATDYFKTMHSTPAMDIDHKCNNDDMVM